MGWIEKAENCLSVDPISDEELEKAVDFAQESGHFGYANPVMVQALIARLIQAEKQLT